jgi:hypothetical protein
MVTAKGSISIGRESLQAFCVLGAVAYLQVSSLGGSREGTWRGQGIRKRSVSWNLPKLRFRTTYVVRNLRCTVTIDSVLANSKTQNPFLFPFHAMFRHDCPLAVKPASTPWRLVHKKAWRDSLPIDMLPLGVTIPATVPQRSGIPEGLKNFPIYMILLRGDRGVDGRIMLG